MVRASTREGIATLGLDRPEKGNALSVELVASSLSTSSTLSSLVCPSQKIAALRSCVSVSFRTIPMSNSDEILVRC